MEPVIKLSDVSKEFKVLKRTGGLRGSIKDLFSRNYNFVKAVNNISMDILPGEIVGYLGSNGAGKSTTIKMMTGVLEPTSGEICVHGRIPYKNRTKNAQEIGVVFGQRTQLWWALPLIESFKILKDIYQINDHNYTKMLALYESLVDIKPLYHKLVREMSLGQRTLCDILAAFLHNPSVVFLDEPTIGLDVSMKSKIRNLIKELNKEKGTTVILTTHDMGDVDALCKRIVIIDKGAMLYDNSIENLRSFFGSYRTLKLRFSKYDDAVADNEINSVMLSVKEKLAQQFPNITSTVISVDEGWVSILINEAEILVLEVMNFIQSFIRIYDLKIEEISTESVVKKIYDGGLK